MTDYKNNRDTPEPAAFTKNEAKSALTFDGRPRNLPPVEPVGQESPERRDRPANPRVLSRLPENRNKPDDAKFK